MITGQDRDESETLRERARRAPLSLGCDVRQDQRRPWTHSRLLNLSEAGFCIVWVPALELGRGLWLRIPGLQLLKANIRWRSGSTMGAEFEQRLHPAVFEHIVHHADNDPTGFRARMWPA